MLFARRLFACLAMLAPACVLFAQDRPPEQPTGEAAGPPALRLPTANDLRLSAPRPVQAVAAALGLGRQRLALVVGNGTAGSQQVLASAPRDTQAVAAALREAGFVVMVREDLSAADLRASLAELRGRLQPGGLGFVYMTALAAQVDGKNLWLPREAPLGTSLPPADLAKALGQAGVPVTEIVDALLGTADSPRLLVLDAAYQHPALAGLPHEGLAEQKLPPGMVALFSSALGVAQPRPAASDLPAAPAAGGAKPAELAASRFARTLVGAIATPRVTGAEALRSTRKTLFDSSQGRVSPWLSGDNDSREELAESTLLDSLIPRTPEDLAREALKQATSQGRRAAGEQSVAEVLQQAAPSPATAPAGGAGGAASPADAGNGRMSAQSATRPTLPAAPSASSLVSGLGTAASTVATVAGVGAAAAGLAAGTAVEGVMAAQAVSTVVGLAGTVGSVASTAGSVAGNMVALASRLGSDSAVTAPATAAATAATAPAAAVLAPAAVAAAGAAGAGALATPATAAGVPVGAATPARTTDPGPAAVQPSNPHQQPTTSPSLPQPAAPGPARTAQGVPLDGRTAPNASGGERPVYLPRTNSFGYAEGDTYTYQVTDTWKGEVTGSYTTAIEEVLGDGQLLANGAQVQMDAQGRITMQRSADGSVSTFEPRQDLWWSNPQRGERRELLFKETFQRADAAKGHTEWKGAASVGRPRKIDTPAGPYEVLPIESSGWYYETLDGGAKSSGQWSRTVWYSPKLGHPVAIEIEDADRVGKLLRRTRVELLHAQTSRGAP